MSVEVDCGAQSSRHLIESLLAVVKSAFYMYQRGYHCFCFVIVIVFSCVKCLRLFLNLLLSLYAAIRINLV